MSPPGIPANADSVCFMHASDYLTVPDDRNLLNNAGQGVSSAYVPWTYDSTMPSAWRCDNAEGTTIPAGHDIPEGTIGHGPFGLRQSATGWYRLPAGKELPTAPQGEGHHCGTKKHRLAQRVARFSLRAARRPIQHPCRRLAPATGRRRASRRDCLLQRQAL